jgi:hypothetical protein
MVNEQNAGLKGKFRRFSYAGSVDRSSGPGHANFGPFLPAGGSNVVAAVSSRAPKIQQRFMSLREDRGQENDDEVIVRETINKNSDGIRPSRKLGSFGQLVGAAFSFSYPPYRPTTSSNNRQQGERGPGCEGNYPGAAAGQRRKSDVAPIQHQHQDNTSRTRRCSALLLADGREEEEDGDGLSGVRAKFTTSLTSSTAESLLVRVLESERLKERGVMLLTAWGRRPLSLLDGYMFSGLLRRRGRSAVFVWDEVVVYVVLKLFKCHTCVRVYRASPVCLLCSIIYDEYSHQ